MLQTVNEIPLGKDAFGRKGSYDRIVLIKRREHDANLILPRNYRYNDYRESGKQGRRAL